MKQICLYSLAFICGTVIAAGTDVNSDDTMKDESGYVQRLETLEKETEQLKSQLKEVVEVQPRQQIQISNEVGFTAVISNNRTSLVAGQTIVFDRVISNIGSGYGKEHGVFTAPSSGTYLFYATIMSMDRNGYIETEVVKDGVELVKMYSGGSSAFGSSGNMVIVSLQQGDHVWVQVNRNYSSTVSIHSCFSTFSGYQLRLD